MKLISRIEELIIVNIWRLGEDAYGIKILNELQRTTGKTWLTGSIYASLARMLKQNLVEAIEGEPAPERGGRRKIYYRVTDQGFRALKDIQEIQLTLWEGLPAITVNEDE